MGFYYAASKREIVMTMLENGCTWADASRLTGISVSSINRWSRRMRTGKGLLPILPKGPRPCSVTEAGILFLQEQIASAPDLTLREMVQLLRDKLEIHTSKSSVDRALKKAKITRKKRHFSPRNRKQNG